MWDWIITILVIFGFIIAVWSKVARQTPKETIQQIIELFKEAKESSAEQTEEIASYGYYD